TALGCPLTPPPGLIRSARWGGASSAMHRPPGCPMPPKAASPVGRGGGVGRPSPTKGPQAASPPRSLSAAGGGSADGGFRRGEGLLPPFARGGGHGVGGRYP